MNSDFGEHRDCAPHELQGLLNGVLQAKAADQKIALTRNQAEAVFENLQDRLGLSSFDVLTGAPQC